MNPPDSDSRETTPLPALIHGLARSGLDEICARAKQPRFRSDQVWRWLYVSRVASWDGMRNVPAAFRRQLAAEFSIEPVRAVGSSGGTAGARKLLLGLRDGEAVEMVIIPSARRTTVCLSSQVGCKFKCAFCASGQGGFKRNLEAGELVGQVLAAAAETGGRPSNVVYMGIGEPLDNYDEVLRSVRILNDEKGLAIGARRITISTCGIVPGIRRLAGENLQVELSVSLHAPDDVLRSRLMPVNARHPLNELIGACRGYTAATGRIITFEYTMISGVNDSKRHCEALCALLKGLQCRVNLIPLSEVEEFDGKPSAPGRCDAFLLALERAGINTTLRRSQGGSVKAACGQLRASRSGRRIG